MKKICLSGAISNHEKEAEIYFAEAEKAIQERYPLAKIFNPTKMPRQKSWEDYMLVCKSRIQNWADGIVFIINPYITESKGVAEEHELASLLSIPMFNFENGKIVELKGNIK